VNQHALQTRSRNSYAAVVDARRITQSSSRVVTVLKWTVSVGFGCQRIDPPNHLRRHRLLPAKHAPEKRTANAESSGEFVAAADLYHQRFSQCGDTFARPSSSRSLVPKLRWVSVTKVATVALVVESIRCSVGPASSPINSSAYRLSPRGIGTGSLFRPSHRFEHPQPAGDPPAQWL
jgi:hypothetical protein